MPQVAMNDAYLLVDYVYLDSEERKRFAQSSHEYLIEQVQHTGTENLSSKIEKYRLNFNHPGKVLIWAPHLGKYSTGERFVAWAADGNWEAARELLAKQLWIAAYGTTDERNLLRARADPVSNEVIPADADLADALAGLVEAQVIADATTLEPATVVLLKNELTVAHLSMTVAEWARKCTTDVARAYLASVSVVARDHFNYGRNVDGSVNPVSSALLQLNGHDRFQLRDGSYFNYVQPYHHWPNTPADGINSYSFALNPAEHQPSGTCNFSRIDNTTLQVNVEGVAADLGTDSVCNLFLFSYNVLRIMGGMGGLAYSN